jgi:hypothetical protein
MAKFIYDRIKIAQKTYHWLESATAVNFKLAMRERAIEWLTYIKTTEIIDVSL